MSLNKVKEWEIRKAVQELCKKLMEANKLLKFYEKENKALKTLLSFTDCPQTLIDNPSVISGKVTKKDIEWAKKEIADYEKTKHLEQ